MADFIIGGLVLIAVIFAVRKVIKNQKSGGCGCGCDGCSSATGCDAFDALETEAKEALKNQGSGSAAKPGEGITDHTRQPDHTIKENDTR